MRRGAALAVCAALAFTLVASAQPTVVVAEAWAMTSFTSTACPHPYASSCPPPPGDPQCVAREHAESHDGRVRAELVEDGNHLDLVAVHLVVRVDGNAFVRSEIGHRGVGCGTFEMYATTFDVLELRVGDVLGDASPEVILRAVHPQGQIVYVCSTNGPAPRCATTISSDPLVRYARPDTVIVDRARTRVRMPIFSADR